MFNLASLITMIDKFIATVTITLRYNNKNQNYCNDIIAFIIYENRFRKLP